MKKALLAAALAGTMTLAACGTIPPGDTTSQVRYIAQLTCQFVPTAETIADIIAAGNPLVSTASQIADAICAALAKQSAGRGVGPAKVGNVVIRGSYKR